MYHKRTSVYIRIAYLVLSCLMAISAWGQTPCSTPTPAPSLKFKAVLRHGRLASNPTADLDQCANGGVGDPAVQCTGSAWQNGNLCQQQAHYLEGQSVPYRMKFSNLVPNNTYTVTIEWDTTENSGSKHALDYLTSFDETESTADPCSGVAGCILPNKNTDAIPVDPNVAMGNDGLYGTPDDVAQLPGVFTLFNGSITGISGYTMTGSYSGASQTSVTMTFTADTTNPVLAWGGHISTRADWGVDNSAIAINGSPFHMRLVDFNGSGGNQDRALASDATIFPGLITVIKDTVPNTGQSFDFTALGPGAFNFSLMDDGSGSGNTQAFNNLTNFGASNSVTITENPSLGSYYLQNVSCTEFAAGGSGQQNTTTSVSNRNTQIILEEGEVVTCTFVNNLVTAAQASISGRVRDSYGMSVSNATVLLTDLSTGVLLYARTNPFGYYRFTALRVQNAYLIRVSSKRSPLDANARTISLMEDLANVDFVLVR